ncbi:MAG: TnpV protein [Christensenellales bacterium]
MLTGALNAYLHTVDEQASERFDVLMEDMPKLGITEALKAEDPIKWVGLIWRAEAGTT